MIDYPYDDDIVVDRVRIRDDSEKSSDEFQPRWIIPDDVIDEMLAELREEENPIHE